MAVTVSFKRARRHLCKRRLRKEVAELKLRTRRTERRANNLRLRVLIEDYEPAIVFATNLDIT